MLTAFIIQQAFIQIAHAFLAGAVPIKLVDFAHQRGKRVRFLDERAGVSGDLFHQIRAVTAKVDQQDFVEFQAIRCGACFQIAPAIALGELIFRVRFLGHFEEQQISQFGDVLG